jgi:hypothetical protein
MRANPLPEISRLREALVYDPASGEFNWRKTLSNAATSGQTAGTKNSKGYVLICVDGKRYQASRIAWKYVTGDDPGESEVDHINRVRADNRFANLRLADRKTNCENINVPRHNTSGFKGVARRRDNGRWQAYIYHHKRRIHLGTFSDIDLAIAARQVAEESLFRGITGEPRT